MAKVGRKDENEFYDLWNKFDHTQKKYKEICQKRYSEILIYCLWKVHDFLYRKISKMLKINISNDIKLEL